MEEERKMLIGREREVSFLEEVVSRKESQLVAVYGRRRIGMVYRLF